MKVNPPPDVDKQPAAGVDNSCWMATASRMLAGAGYGSGVTMQLRAEDIYADMVANYGIANSGWIDTALSWWLASANNVWPYNPYTVVTVEGNKFPKVPWPDADGPMTIGNHLRNCSLTGLSISWPTDAVDAMGNPVVGSGGHAITGWGDNISRRRPPISSNPTRVRVTDSDRDVGGNVQVYAYDSFTNPNPGGANEGNGWYINYDPNHPYIKHIAVLSPVQRPGGGGGVLRVVGSFRIHQSRKQPASDLHYKVGTDVDILSYHTDIDWTNNLTPAITEDADPPRQLTVDWDLSPKPVPYCTWITITTEFFLRRWNALEYTDVRFTYPDQFTVKEPIQLKWELVSPMVDQPERIPNITGGYVIGAFDVLDPQQQPEQRRVLEYRFVHQYSYDQSPEQHTLRLSGRNGLILSNLKIGHSYGYLSGKRLWDFKNWMTERGDDQLKLQNEPTEVRIDWGGRLPYPQGEDIRGRIPGKKEGLRKD